jgi:O-antigen/teichoic acid export membrane protein
MNIPFKIAFNTSAQLVGKIASTASVVIVTILITRNFSVTDFGNYIAILSYITLFFVFTDFGLNAIFVRETGSDEEKQKQYFKNLLGLRLVMAILVAFAATAILAFTNHSNLVKLGILIGLGIIIAQSFVATSLALFQARIRYDQAAIADISRAIANVIFVYLAATNFQNILFIIGALLLGNTVRMVVALYLANFQIGTLGFTIDRNFWQKLFSAALPIGLITVFSQFNAQIDKQIVLLANYKPSLGLSGEAAAGFYGLAYRVFELAIVLPTYIMNVGYPIMVQKKEQGTDILVKFSKKLALWLLILGFFGLIVGWFFVPFAIDILGGDKFSPSILTTRILLLGFPLFFVTPLTLWLAVTLKKLKEMLFIYGFVAVFNLVANLVFVPNFGYNAAAGVTIVSELFLFLLSIGVLAIYFKAKKI